VPFDATPAAPVAGSISRDWAPNPYQPAPTPSTNPGPPGRGGRDPGDLNPSSGAIGDHDPGASDSGAGRAATPAERWRAWTGLGVLALVLVLATPALWRLRVRRQRRPQRLRPATGPPPEAADDIQVVVTSDDTAEARRRQAHG